MTRTRPDVLQVSMQLEVAEVGIDRRRQRMVTLLERSDEKVERLRRIRLELAMLDENEERSSFNEDLEECLEIVEPSLDREIESRSGQLNINADSDSALLCANVF